MIKRLNNTLLFLLLLLPSAAFAGSASGGGGNAVVCRDQGGQITSAELLDFYAGKMKLDLNTHRSDLPLETQLENVDRLLQKLYLVDRFDSQDPRPHWQDYPGRQFLGEAKKWIQSGFADNNEFKLVKKPTRIRKSPDANLPFMDDNCQEEGLAYWDDSVLSDKGDGRLFIQKEIFEKLPETDKVGLLVHELFYKEMRKMHGNQIDSLATQNFVSLLFQMDHSQKKQLEALARFGFLPNKWTGRDHIGALDTLENFVDASGPWLNNKSPREFKTNVFVCYSELRSDDRRLEITASREIFKEGVFVTGLNFSGLIQPFSSLGREYAFLDANGLAPLFDWLNSGQKNQAPGASLKIVETFINVATGIKALVTVEVIDNRLFVSLDPVKGSTTALEMKREELVCRFRDQKY